MTIRTTIHRLACGHLWHSTETLDMLPLRRQIAKLAPLPDPPLRHCQDRDHPGLRFAITERNVDA